MASWDASPQSPTLHNVYLIMQYFVLHMSELIRIHFKWETSDKQRLEVVIRMKYRKGKLEDCKAIYSLICDMENKELLYDRFCAIYQDQLSDGHYYCLVCEQDGVVVGVLNIRFEAQLHHTERIAEILEFAVATTIRNKGIGKEMFVRSCQIAEDNDCSQIEVACNQLRKDTHRFYMREGMNNFHFKFSKRLIGNNILKNSIGR